MASTRSSGATTPTVRTIDVASNYDLTFQVYEYNKKGGKDEKGNYKDITKITNVKVVREIVEKEVPALKAMLSNKHFTEAGQSAVELHEDNGGAIGLLMLIIHGTVGHESYKVPPADMFELVAVADKYLYAVAEDECEEFFKTWYETSSKPSDVTEDDYNAQLMYLTFRFDYAQGFQKATKWLAYNAVGHIDDSNPTEHSQLRLQRRIFNVLNGARGSLRTMLFDGTFAPINSNHQTGRDCTCRYRVEYEYNDLLFKAGFYPLERTSKSKCIDDLLDCLSGLKFEAHKDACMSCRAVGFTTHIRETRARVDEAFDGLCLDCMRACDIKGGTATFFARTDRNGIDGDCRISHGSKSWYFSYMGDMEQMKSYQQKKKRDRSSFYDSD